MHRRHAWNLKLAHKDSKAHNGIKTPYKLFDNYSDQELGWNQKIHHFTVISNGYFNIDLCFVFIFLINLGMLFNLESLFFVLFFNVFW